MTVTEAWEVLGLAPTDDARAAKRAYSALLKKIDVDRDPAAFIRLREALELSLQHGAEIPSWETDDFDDSADWSEDDAAATFDGGDTHFCEHYAGTDSWPPPAPPSGTSPLATASQRLSRLLFDEDQADLAEIKAAGTALLTEMDAASVDEASATERWLLGALVDSIPRSDPLIGPAMDHFGWDDAARPRDYGFGYDIESLRQRRSDLAVLTRLLAVSLDGSGPFTEKFDDVRDRRAIEELGSGARKALSPFRLSLASDVRWFLNGTLANHPTIEHDLDPEQLAFWRGYFQGRHLPDLFWFILVLAPPIMVYLVGIAFTLGGVPAPISIPAGFGLAFAVTLGGIMGFIELRARSSARERAIYDQGYQSRRAEPWLALSLALPPLAALTPFGLATGIGWTAVALAVVIGAFLGTRAPVKEQGETMLGPRSLSIITLVACAAVGFALIPAGSGQLLGPLLALCYVGHRGHEAAAISMSGISPARARTIIAGPGLLAGAAMVPLFLFTPGLPPAVLLMLVPVAAAAQHLATPHLFLDTRGIEWGTRIVAMIFYFSFGPWLFGTRNEALIATILLYVLAYSLARLALAFRQSSGRLQEPPPYF